MKIIKNSGIVNSKIVGFILVSQKKAWQSVCSSISPSLIIINLEIVVKELLGLSNLSKA